MNDTIETSTKTATPPHPSASETVESVSKKGAEDELKQTTAAAESSEEPSAPGDPREHLEHESEKSQVDEAARVERYSEADPSYLPVGSGQPAGQDIKTIERVG